MAWRLRQLWTTATGRLAFSAALLALCGSYGIREDELKCEQALHALTECCGSLQGHYVRCSYTASCDHGNNPTDFTADTSDCLLGKSCEELQNEGICDTATWPDQKSPSCH